MTMNQKKWYKKEFDQNQLNILKQIYKLREIEMKEKEISNQQYPIINFQKITESEVKLLSYLRKLQILMGMEEVYIKILKT